MNACIMANYRLAARESNERRDNLALHYDGPVYFVIPRYYIFHHCGRWGQTPCRDSTGDRLYTGVAEVLLQSGMHAQFTEHILSKGLVCVVSVEQVSPENYYVHLLSLATATVLPAYTTRQYVLSFAVLLDFKEIKVYQYDITEKALSGLFMWLLAPMVPFLNDAGIGWWNPGPLSPVIREATKTFWQEAHRDGIL